MNNPRPSTRDILAKIRAQKESGQAAPITPDEVVAKKAELIPSGVIEAFNELIAKHFDGSSATIKQEEVVALIREKMNCTRNKVFDEKWLDIEPLFNDVGWRVDYDKPAYNENYEATFEFSRAR